MRIEIDKQSDVPIRQQLREQIIFQIGTGQLPIGHVMPSVRELERQSGVHHNTVNKVYADLVCSKWLVKRCLNSRLVVVQRTKSAPGLSDFKSLDELVAQSMRAAHEHGYTAEQFATRVQEHLQRQTKDHWIVIAPETALAELISEEIRLSTARRSQAFGILSLLDAQELTGAVVISPNILVEKVKALSPSYRNIIPISYSPADEYLGQIRSLPKPSVVGVLSMSLAFLKTARGVLGPAIGKRHTLRMFLMEKPVQLDAFAELDDRVSRARAKEDFRASSWEGPDQKSPAIFKSSDLKDFDLLFCDSICYRVIEARRTRYQLVSGDSLNQIRAQAIAEPIKLSASQH